MSKTSRKKVFRTLKKVQNVGTMLKIAAMTAEMDDDGEDSVVSEVITRLSDFAEGVTETIATGVSTVAKLVAKDDAEAAKKKD